MHTGTGFITNNHSQIDTTELQNNVTNTGSIFDNTDLNPSLLSALKAAVQAKQIQDYYDVYLWNFCSGSASDIQPTFCSARKTEFYFDPITEWGLNSPTLEALLPSELTNGLKVYDKVSKWLFIAYTLAFWTTAASIVVGIFATCSRWGSCLTTLVSSAATLFTILSAATSTALFGTVVATLDTVLKPYDIKLHLGVRMQAVDWLAVVLSAAATLFWTISICCCSGKSPHAHPRRGRNNAMPPTNAAYPAQRQPTFPFLNRGYAKLDEQQAGVAGQEYAHLVPGPQPQVGMEMHDYAAAAGASGPYQGREGAYEPFRHQRGLSAVSDVSEV